jgi:1-hydroxy-2-naphthoate dioxygenase
VCWLKNSLFSKKQNLYHFLKFESRLRTEIIMDRTPSAMPSAAPPANDTLRVFDAKLATHSMRGQWTAEPMLQAAIGGPRPAGKPHLWSWPMVEALLAEAGKALPESMEARRSLLFNNPGLPTPTATHTINMGIQQILPGETAWAHRHSIAALRFIVEGSLDAKTVVDGEPCPMEEFDLILTPSWTWHDHRNRSSRPVTWVDILDIPLVCALNQIFYQPYGELTQPETVAAERVAPRIGTVRPVWEQPARERLAVRYPWREVEARLRELAGHAGSPHDGVALEYVNPITGGPTLPTLSAWVQWLKPGQKTARHRHTSSAVYFVVRGEGRTLVDGEELSWKPRDCFVVPNWSWHAHENLRAGDEAILFSVNDALVLAALGLYREEADGAATRR